jgi:hypothetical protein
MAYLHPDKLVAVDRILLRKKAKQGVRRRPKPPSTEQVAAQAFGQAKPKHVPKGKAYGWHMRFEGAPRPNTIVSKRKKKPTPRTSGMIGRLAARL